MPKQCVQDDCGYPQFGGGYCRRHQFLRTDKTGKPLRRVPIKKVSKKQRAILGEKAKLTKRDREFFAEILAERDFVDFETGQPITEEPATLHFHHVLPKRPKAQGGYPEHRYKKWNIVLVSWNTHSKAENNLDLVPKIKAYRDMLLTKYT